MLIYAVYTIVISTLKLCIIVLSITLTRLPLLLFNSVLKIKHDNDKCKCL